MSSLYQRLYRLYIVIYMQSARIECAGFRSRGGLFLKKMPGFFRNCLFCLYESEVSDSRTHLSLAVDRASPGLTDPGHCYEKPSFSLPEV